jgi:RimJ/RimL family protein N-acetyltransferase
MRQKKIDYVVSLLMNLSLWTILEPPAPIAGARRASRSYALPGHDAIPVITLCQRTLSIRTAVPADVPLLADLLARLSERTSRLRFFGALKSIEQIWREAARMANSGPQRHGVLVATIKEHGEERAVAVAELAHDPDDPAVAEFAVVVRDDYQHEGLGTMITQLLIQLATLRGVRSLQASMLAENQVAYRLVRGLGTLFTAETRRGETTLRIGLPRG